jgi:fatty acid desaturase
MTSSEGNRLYGMLRRELRDAGCFEPIRWRQVGYMIFVASAFGIGYVTLLGDVALGPRLAMLVLIAAANVHAGFVAHEIGHGAVTRNRRVAMVTGQFFLTFLTALSYGHFQDIHTRHHAHCNRHARDPDMQSGAFSMYLESALEKRGLGWLVTRYQAVLIWILVSIQGFTLKIDSLRFMCREPRRARVDWLVLPLHVAFWIGLPTFVLGFEVAAVNYVLLTWFAGPYLGAIFLVNHIGTVVLGPDDDDISFFEHQISTTRNLGATRIADFLFGGLNNHIEHHLFPTLPRRGLRRARTITREFCRRHDIPYRETNWFGAAVEVSRYFREVTESARTIRREARTAAGTAPIQESQKV